MADHLADHPADHLANRRVDARKGEPVTTSLTEIAAVIEDIYPLTPQQRGLFLQLLRAPESAAYVNQFTVRVHGADPVATRRAWETLAARHPVLRTGFLW